MSKSLNTLVASLKDVEAITDRLQREWALIQLRKQYQLTIKEFAQLRALIQNQEVS